MSGPAKKEFRCFFCEEVFTDPDAARDHFGATGEEVAACRLKAAEGGLLRALRGAERDAREAREALHAESADGLRAWRGAESRHRMAERAAEESGYEKGVADGRNPETAAELCVIIRRWLDRDGQGWGDFEHILDGLTSAPKAEGEA